MLYSPTYSRHAAAPGAMFFVVLVILIGGSLDLMSVSNQKSSLQTLADNAALAAVNELSITSQDIPRVKAVAAAYTKKTDLDILSVNTRVNTDLREVTVSIDAEPMTNFPKALVNMKDISVSATARLSGQGGNICMALAGAFLVGTALWAGGLVDRDPFDESEYENTLVKFGVAAAMFWGIAGLLVGVVIALQLTWPSLFYFPELGWTNFGRLRPLHTSAVIFAFGGNVLLATSFYVVQRTCRTRIAGGMDRNSRKRRNWPAPVAIPCRAPLSTQRAPGRSLNRSQSMLRQG